MAGLEPAIGQPYGEAVIPMETVPNRSTPELHSRLFRLHIHKITNILRASSLSSATRRLMRQCPDDSLCADEATGLLKAPEDGIAERGGFEPRPSA